MSNLNSLFHLKSAYTLPQFPWQLEIFLLSLIWNLCLAQEHNTWLGLEPRPFDPESSTLTPKQGFWCFARSRSRKIQVNQRNPTKFTKTRKILRKLVKILSNRCLYNIFETYFSYWGNLLAANLQIYLESSSLKRGNVPKLPGVVTLRKTGH